MAIGIIPSPETLQSIADSKLRSVVVEPPWIEHDGSADVPEAMRFNRPVDIRMKDGVVTHNVPSDRVVWGDVTHYRPAWMDQPAARKPSTNPKDAIGSVKLPLHLWPSEATAMGCLGMLEGMLKYGRNNYIAGDGVIASIYVDACTRHLHAWMAGEDATPDTNSPHLANALACLAILVKAQAHGKMIDDRDYAPESGAYRALVEHLTPHVKALQAMFADRNPKHYTIADNGR